MVAAHAEHAVGHDDRAGAVLRRRFEATLKLAHVEVLVDVLFGWSRQRDRVDDAIMVEFVADDRGLVGDERRDYAHDRGISRGEQHSRRPGVEGREPPLQRDVRRPCSADEAHRAGADAIARGGRFLRRDHFRAQRHAEIIVGIHAQERRLALAFDEISWTAIVAGGQ